MVAELDPDQPTRAMHPMPQLVAIRPDVSGVSGLTAAFRTGMLGTVRAVEARNPRVEGGANPLVQGVERARRWR